MDSKGVKAIIIVYEGLPRAEHADSDASSAGVKKFAAALGKHAVTGHGLPTYRTNILANIINEAGGYPTRNFSSGRFEMVENISGKKQREITLERRGDVKHGRPPAASSGAPALDRQRQQLSHEGSRIREHVVARR